MCGRVYTFMCMYSQFFNVGFVFVFVGVTFRGDAAVLVSLGTRTFILLLLSDVRHHLSLLLSRSFSSFPLFLYRYFLIVWTMRRSILRCVARISLSCSSVDVHVPEPYIIVGVMTEDE